jgi:hypothetical protein
MAYARKHGVGTHLLLYWSKKFPVSKVAATKVVAHHVRTVEPFVQIPLPSSQGHIEIRLPNGALVRVMPGADPGLVRVVVQALSGAMC